MKPEEAPCIDTKGHKKARKAYEATILQAYRDYWSTKEQAEIIYKKAIKQDTDKRAREEAEIKFQEVLRQARKVRNEVMDEAKKALGAGAA